MWKNKPHTYMSRRGRCNWCRDLICTQGERGIIGTKTLSRQIGSRRRPPFVPCSWEWYLYIELLFSAGVALCMPKLSLNKECQSPTCIVNGCDSIYIYVPVNMAWFSWFRLIWILINCLVISRDQCRLQRTT